ncbi:MAG: hypothetical protein FE834_04180 [Gammaproteobacteria bacterium]|nr:hypothetical protein [Gammaproteobacteria bacterium]
MIRTITGLGLAEAKKLINSTPVIIKGDVDKVEAKSIQQQFERVGADVVLRGSNIVLLNVKIDSTELGMLSGLKNTKEILEQRSKIYKETQKDLDKGVVNGSGIDENRNVWHNGKMVGKYNSGDWGPE